MDQPTVSVLMSCGEVAILPTRYAPVCAVLEVARVAHADVTSVRLQDGRIFDAQTGVGLDTSGYIAPLTHEHRKVLKMLGTDEVSCRPHWHLRADRWASAFSG